jgi:hypothetical protein
VGMSNHRTTLTVGQRVKHVSGCTGTVIGTSGGWSRCHTIRFHDEEQTVCTYPASTNSIVAA